MNASNLKTDRGGGILFINIDSYGAGTLQMKPS